MKRAIWISVLAILGFAIILLVRLPASWLKGLLPPQVSCADISGTAWNGGCAGVAYNGARLGDLTWELHPSALFRGKLAAFVDLTRGEDFIRGEVEAGRGGHLEVRDLQAQMPLDPPPLPELSSGYTGNVSVNLAHLRVEKRVIAMIEGQIETTSLYSKRDRMAIGSYAATFPKADPATEPVGQLMALDGPVDFEGTLKLTREPGWVIDGKVRTKPETPQQLARQFEYLGTPDPDGSRPLRLEGTF
jgi:general secretion pathway protein N